MSKLTITRSDDAQYIDFCYGNMLLASYSVDTIVEKYDTIIKDAKLFDMAKVVFADLTINHLGNDDESDFAKKMFLTDAFKPVIL